MTNNTDNRRYPARPVVGIGIVIWRGDKVLLIKRGREPRLGEWGLPGGAQQLGETIFAAAAREAFEETGLTVTPTHIVTAFDAVTRDAAGAVEYHYTIIDLAAEYETGEASAQSDVTDICWATIGEVASLCAWPEVARVVRLSAALRVG